MIVPITVFVRRCRLYLRVAEQTAVGSQLRDIRVNLRAFVLAKRWLARMRSSS